MKREVLEESVDIIEETEDDEDAIYIKGDSATRRLVSEYAISPAYMKWVKSFELLTAEQEKECSEIIMPLIHVREQIKALEEKVAKPHSSHGETDPAKRKKFSAQLRRWKKKEAIIRADLAFQRARRILVEHNLRWVIAVAKRYKNRGMLLKDLIQIGTLGLIHAAEKFDWKRGRFSTYSIWWIRQTITRTVNQDGIIRKPDYIAILIPRMLEAKEIFIAQHGYEPEIGILADLCETRADWVESALAAGSVVVSLEAPAKDGNSRFSLYERYADDAESPFDNVYLNEQRTHLAKKFKKLTRQEREVIRLRFGLSRFNSHTFQEIAKMKHLSRERIRQVQKAGLQKLGLSDEAITELGRAVIS